LRAVMNINELLLGIKDLAKNNRIARPFIVGGAPRDRVMGARDKINDLDITTGDSDSIRLAELVANKSGAKHRTYDDGHSSINIDGIRLDFSNNFNAPGIDEEIKKIGVKDITAMKREIYSRDFTINTLLEELDLSNIYDLTGEAEGDIKAGLIRCPIDPDISIGSDPRRILRAIKFAIKYDFKIEDRLKSAMLKHREKIKMLPERFTQDRMNEIVRLDNNKGIEALIEYKILSSVPLTKSIYDVLIRRKQLVDYI